MFAAVLLSTIPVFCHAQKFSRDPCLCENPFDHDSDLDSNVACTVQQQPLPFAGQLTCAPRGDSPYKIAPSYGTHWDSRGPPYFCTYPSHEFQSVGKNFRSLMGLQLYGTY